MNPCEGATSQAVAGDLVVNHADPGQLRLSGADRLEFVNRMSTNALADLPRGAIAPTVFTTPVGRTVDYSQVINLDDHLLLLTTPGRADALAEWLRRHIFFRDGVSCEDLPEPRHLWGLYGPAALDEAGRLFPGLARPAEGQVAEIKGSLLWQVDRPLRGMHLLLGENAHAEASSIWPAGPAELEAYDVLRIEAGMPAWGREIREQSIPLEVGLRDAINFSKGCYIGQEIIARMESRGRQAKQLVGIRISGPASAGTEIKQGGSRIGTLTSAAQSPEHGWIGLAVVKPAAFGDQDGIVQVGSNGLQARLTPLPFSSPS